MRHALWIIPAAVFLVDGYLHGVSSSRWQDHAELDRAVRRLSHVPTSVGNWQGTSIEMPERAVKLAGFSGYVQRRYENTRTGAVLTFLIACGPSGPISLHSPEVCYQGAGFVQTEPSKKHGLEGTPNEFWVAGFAKNTPLGPERVRVVWSWSRSRGWQAPDSARFAFSGAPVLFKIYVSQGLGGASEQGPFGKDHCAEFLNEMLPQLEASVFSATTK